MKKHSEGADAFLQVLPKLSTCQSLHGPDVEPKTSRIGVFGGFTAKMAQRTMLVFWVPDQEPTVNPFCEPLFAASLALPK